MRHAFPALLALTAPGALLLACATTPGAPASIERGTLVDERGGVVETTRTTVTVVDSLALAAPAAMAAVQNAYVALGLVPNLVDPVRHVIGVRQVVIARRLQGVPLTAYVDCGADVNGIPLAVNDRVELTMLTELREATGRTTLHTALVARALRASSGAQMDPQRCASRGALEAKVGRTARGVP